MKKLNYILPLLMLTLFSCSDFLDRDAKNQVSNDDIFTTIDGAEFALVGTYASMTKTDYYGENMIVVPEWKSGNIKFAKEAGSFDLNKYYASYNFAHTPSDDNNDDVSKNMYRQMYEVLNQANNIINYLPETETHSEKLKNQIMGEALVLRALIHFDLTRLFAQPYIYTTNATHDGVATLLQTPDVLAFPWREPLYKTYEQIQADLLDAMPLLTTVRSGTITKANIRKEVAHALMARVSLYKGEWQTAANYADSLISNNNYELLEIDDYVDSWKEQTPSKEDIFVLNMSNNTSVYMAEVYGKAVNYDNDIKQTAAVMTNDLLNLYDSNDKRLELFESVVRNDTVTDVICTKYYNFDSNERFYPLIRLSEMYLIKAEANAELGFTPKAISTLDDLRLKRVPGASSTSVFGQDLIDEIMKERRKELCLEGHTFFDCIRKGKGVSRVDFNGTENRNISFPNDMLILPIPQHELDYNPNIFPNPGY